MSSEARMAATSTGPRPPELIDDSAKQSKPTGTNCRPCETKPAEASESVCSVPARAYEETPYGVTTNGTDSAKQSQPAGPEALAIADFRLQIADRRTLERAVRNKAKRAGGPGDCGMGRRLGELCQTKPIAAGRHDGVTTTKGAKQSQTWIGWGIWRTTTYGAQDGATTRSSL